MWSKYEKEKNLATVLKEISQAGYKGAQLSFEPEVENVRGLLDKLGLQVAVVQGPSTKEAVDFCSSLDCKVLLQVAWDKPLEQYAKEMQGIATYAAGKKVELSMHTHLGTSIETREQLEEFFSKCLSPNVKLCLDTAHLAGADVDLADLIHAYTGRINLLHLKDLWEKSHPVTDEEWEREFVDLDVGIIDFPEVFKALKEAGFDGWGIVEVDFPKRMTNSGWEKDSALNCAQRNRLYLEKILRQIDY